MPSSRSCRQFSIARLAAAAVIAYAWLVGFAVAMEEPSPSGGLSSADQLQHIQPQPTASDATAPPGDHDHGEHQHQEHSGASGDDDPHAHHKATMHQQGYERSEHAYRLPDVALVGMDGKATSLLAELNCGKPVMVNFVFTTCTTICPVMTGVFAQVQSQLGPQRDDVRMISVSIDPEYDTPERLRQYATLFKAGPEWRFLTGNLDNVIAVQKAFDVYRGNKMSHQPVTLLRRSDGEPWVRLNGIANAAEIVSEYRALVGR